MIFGNFEDDLNQYIKESGGVIRASSLSTTSILNRGNPASGVLENGKMYAFKYFTPNELVYDTFPIVLGLGQLDNKNQLGLNLHYIPYDYRLPFIRFILNKFSNKIEENLKFIKKPLLQKPLYEFNYENLKRGLGISYNLNYAIKQYRIDRMSTVKLLGLEDWYLGVINNDDRFYGSSMFNVQRNFYKNI